MRLMIFIIAGFLSLADATYAQSPRYSGEIRPITSPMRLSYGSFPRSPMTKTTIVSIPSGGQKQQTKVSGTYEIRESNSNLIVEISVFEGQKRLRMAAEISKSGKFHSITKADFDGIDLLSSDNPIAKQIFRQFEPLFKKGYFEFDSRGYTDGSTLIDEEFDINLMGMRMSMRVKETVLGQTYHNGIRSIVTQASGWISHQGEKGELSGFAVRDVKRGAALISDVVIEIPFSSSDGVKLTTFREIQEIEISSNGPTQATSKTNVKERLRKLRELLDDGLISETEAKSKRQEILKDL